jgi:hypothetical protein
MAVLTKLWDAYDGDSGDKIATATPAVSDLIVVVESTTGVGTTPASTLVSDNNPDGLGDYTRAAGPSITFSTAGRINIWIRNALIGAAVSTDFLLSVASSSGGGLVVFKIVGMTRSGGTAIYSSGIPSNGPAGVTPSVAMSVTPDPTFPVLAAVANGDNPTNIAWQTSPVVYANRMDAGYGPPGTVAGLQIMTVSSGETNTPIVWGSNSASEWAAVVVQLDVSPGGDNAVQLVGHAHRNVGG